MADREIQANHSATSDLLNTHSKEKARRLHPSKEHHDEFYEFVQEAGPDLATKFLDMFEELVQDLRYSPANPLYKVALLHLINFASGSKIMPWEISVKNWDLEGNEPAQEKFIQLAFLRRFPKLFPDERFNLERRAKLLGDPLDSVRNRFLAKVNSLPLKEVDLIEKGYSAAYVGYDDIITPNLDILKQYATSWQSDTQFAPYTCLVGPTMIGKTRLLMKLAEEICVVYICLRDRNSTGEPKRSLLADDMLPSESTYYEYFPKDSNGKPERSLADDMLPSASKYCKYCGEDSTGEPKPDDMPPSASPDYEYYYARFIAAILLVTVQFFQPAPNADINTRYTEWFKHQTTAKFRLNVLQKLKSLPVKTSKELLGLAVEAVHKNALLNPSGLKVLLAVDEASAMLVTPNKTEVSFFRLFRRALRKVPDHAGVLAILVDTTSRVSNFYPTNREDNSSRAIGARGAPPIKLFAPIYKISTFDQMVSSDPPKTWKELFLPDRLCRYGVPFFSIYLNDLKETRAVTNSDPLYAIPAMANFALKKLLCCEDVNGSLKPTEVRALALLGPTIGVPLHGQSHLNVDLTASHAAHCGYLDPTLECQLSFYPSQPIYALAANDYLHKNEAALVFCIRSLASVLSQGHAGKRDAGELASRIILLCAMNKTADDMKIKERKGADQRNNPNQSAPATLPVDSTAFPGPVPVAQFLQTLTGFPVEELHFGTISRENQEKLLGEGMMFWNHFQHCLSTPTPGSLMEGMERGLAMQCHDQQASFDQLLPIYLKGPKDELDETHLTFCGVQVKNCIDDRDIRFSQGIMTRTNAKITTNKDNPYLALRFSLHHEGPPKKKNSDINIRSPQDYRPPDSGRDRKQASLMFYGLQSFHFLSPEVKEALGELINIRTDLISRHKREKDELGENYAKAFLLRDERS